jgi:lysophospholipase L1-like esterase
MWFRCAALVFGFVFLASGATPAQEIPAFPIRDGDRIAWIGSSSTKIGVWPKTMEFLLRTRHPELKLNFSRHTTGGGTYATGAENLDKWLAESHPTLVFFNYGGNDASAGEAGLPKFRDNMQKCLDKVTAAKSRFILLTPQAADNRKSGEEPAAKRKLYASKIMDIAREKQWHAVDIHTPLHALQTGRQKQDEGYTILKDKIHLTDEAYIAWAYFLYERLKPAEVRSLATVDAAKMLGQGVHCDIRDLKIDGDTVRFSRRDHVLPLVPPVALPPAEFVPLESLSKWELRITGLPAGTYEIRIEGNPIGTASTAELAGGVNLNTVAIRSKTANPWPKIVKAWWEGKEIEKIGQTNWAFEVKRLR